MRQSRPQDPRGMPSWFLPALLIAVVVAAAIVFAGYEIGKGSSSPSGPATATAVTQPTTSPASTPTAVPTTSPTSTTATPGASATPAPATPGASTTATAIAPKDVRTTDEAAIVALSYQPGVYAWTDAGSGSRIWAFKGTCTNSGDGYCQKVFFFHDSTLIGTDTSHPSRQILAVVGVGSSPPAIRVKYAGYKPGDADCCPSGKPVSVIYTWNGSSMSAGGTPPGQ